ncbi:stage V sporulation protein AA [Tepidimicrobium xylanilyticum]|mgnify:FL=1|uniref:Stage V sporulation protein AA n=1 Tax=Tepidimicrobium xylanilyticum TaxID=1123352 RepID=A0A1H2SUJ5_9FIRM|nr:stage V sporulation protein AA [Tepidimicrobium xylanilyticum]GMG96110.1 hypothetical protein EN5CB1_09360 [Tepidimicrobium xylanilyticum]SDW35321.1 stage V sporulation protein AA [Tepidimicrobium xylanilyticum]
MIVISNEQVYINLDRKYTTDLNTHVYVEDIGKVYCNDERIKKRVEKIRVYDGKDEEMYDYISSNKIITKILESIDNIDVTILGGPDVLLEIKDKEDSNGIYVFLKTAFIMLVLFFGAGAALINFYEDVNMKSSVEKIYYFITGVKKENPLIMTIPLSFGIGLGMFAFFSRVSSLSKRRKQEPGPLELELYLYDKDLEDYILDDLKKNH